MIDLDNYESEENVKPVALLFKNKELKEKIKVQNFSSCLPAFILNPEKNSYVIDAAAVPGIKKNIYAQ